jgi:hypothetical protein
MRAAGRHPDTADNIAAGSRAWQARIMIGPAPVDTCLDLHFFLEKVFSLIY